MLSVYKVKLRQNSQFEVHILERFNDFLEQKISTALCSFFHAIQDLWL